MLRANLPIIAVIALTVVATTIHAQSLGHDERCQVIEGNGVRVDQCDGTKHLSCKDGRCQCPDPANQVYTYRNEIITTRNKRSPGKKGSGFKKIAAGAVAGAATYHVVNQASKGFKNGFTTTPPPPKYQKVYSCYSRVGGQCALNYNNWQNVDGGSTTTTTTPSTSPESPSNATTEVSTSADNSTTTPAPSTTTAAPQAAAQVSNMDISKIPQCVQYAQCKHVSPPPAGNNLTSSASSGFMQKVEYDPRVGVCECSPGYVRNSRDFCEKVKTSGAGNAETTSFAVMIVTLMINRMFV